MSMCPGDFDERALIKRALNVIRPCPFPVGPGDDSAVVEVDGAFLVIASDSVTLERHKPEGMTFEQFGWMSAAVNFSDIASMGGRPAALTLSLGIPDSLGAQEVCDIMSGADQCAEFCGAYIAGGDTKPGSGFVCGTAIGSMEGRKPMTRRGAVPGDLVAVTGPLGSPAAGYHAMMNGLIFPDAVDALCIPVPRIREGIALASSGIVTSCIDLSDGLATAALTICESSHAGMDLMLEFLPKGADVEDVSEETGVSEIDMMLNFGGEYELLFTFGKEDIGSLYDSGVNFTIIGTVTSGREARLVADDGVRRLEYGRY
jgi:thiamine-monophosphate kinase